MNRVEIEKYKSFCQSACRHYGMHARQASVMVDYMVRTDMLGLYTHGTYYLNMYLDKITAGGMDVSAKPEIVSQGSSWVIIDGHNGVPQAIVHTGIQQGIKKARETGLAYVGMRGSGHFGACGVYAVAAAEQGFLALCMSSTYPNMHAPGGKGSVIGNCPLAYAIPRAGKRPVFMDIALSTVSGTKVMRAKEAGTPIPHGWIYGYDGLPTTNYDEPYALAPMAEHKGYGLAVLVEVLCAVISGGGILKEQMLWHEPGIVPNTSHCMFFLNVNDIINDKTYHDRLLQMTNGLTDAAETRSKEGPRLPGDRAWTCYEDAQRYGLALPDDILSRMLRLAERTGTEFDCLL